MDVGADNFRFSLEGKNGLAAPAQTMRQPKTTEIHLDSLDRYNPRELASTATFQMFPNSQNLAKLAGPILLNSSNNSGTQLTLNPGRNMAYGYFSRVALTQMLLNWECPTVISGVNDQLLVAWGVSPTVPSGQAVATIPAGYYTATTIATALQVAIRALDPLLGAMTVTAPSATVRGFQFSAGGSTYMAFIFAASGSTEQQQVRIGRTAKLLGLNRATFGFPTDPNTGAQSSTITYWVAANGGVPDLIYTDYVDVVSQALSNYKDAKDGASSIQAPSSVIGRIWLTETTPLAAPAANGLPNDPNNIGSGPFSLVKTWYTPNWSQWSPNDSLTSIDITLLDMFGEVIPWNTTFATEWSATLTLSE
jgi:hypothetical protein